MTRVSARVGGPREGGYEYSMNIVCDVDVAEMTDVDRLKQFLDHRKKRCACYPKDPGSDKK